VGGKEFVKNENSTAILMEGKFHPNYGSRKKGGEKRTPMRFRGERRRDSIQLIHTREKSLKQRKEGHRDKGVGGEGKSTILPSHGLWKRIKKTKRRRK